MLKKILIVSAGLVAVFVVFGALAPKEFLVQREITINKPKAFVFEYLRHLKNTDEWSPWDKLDPNIQKELRGAEDGRIGAVYAWRGNKDVGAGEQVITGMIDGERIDLEIRFLEPMKATNRAFYTTAAEGESATVVTWGMSGDTPFPVNVLTMLFDMRGQIGKQFEEGLTNLKSKLEAKEAPAAAG